jgi:hypothetical protein
LRDCRKYEDLLARHLHGEALLPDRDLLEEHLSVCPDCERLYRDVTDVDRLLRDLPGKQVDPPAWLAARIVASLPGERTASAWERWGRWTAGAGALAACALAVAIAMFRDGPPRDPRVATAPAPVFSPASPPTAVPEAALPAGKGEPETPVLRASPEAARRGRGTAVSSAPKERVIKEVKIFFYYPPAHRVAVTGDFNDWDLDGVPMRASGKPGMWAADLKIPPGVYSYNFIVDGEILLPDPDSPNQMPDGYGGTNSVLLVQGDEPI